MRTGDGYLMRMFTQFSKEQVFLFAWLGVGLFFVGAIYAGLQRSQRRNFRAEDPTAPKKRNLGMKTPPKLDSGENKTSPAPDVKRLGKG